MDFGYIKPSAVPHITTLEPNFNIYADEYIYSIIFESIFLIVVVPFLVIQIYFTVKKKQRKAKQNDSLTEISEDRAP